MEGCSCLKEQQVQRLGGRNKHEGQRNSMEASGTGMEGERNERGGDDVEDGYNRSF